VVLAERADYFLRIAEQSSSTVTKAAIPTAKVNMLQKKEWVMCTTDANAAMTAKETTFSA